MQISHTTIQFERFLNNEKNEQFRIVTNEQINTVGLLSFNSSDDLDENFIGIFFAYVFDGVAIENEEDMCVFIESLFFSLSNKRKKFFFLHSSAVRVVKLKEYFSFPSVSNRKDKKGDFVLQMSSFNQKFEHILRHGSDPKHDIFW